MAPEMRPKSFGTFEKQAPGLDPEHRTMCGIRLLPLYFNLQEGLPLSIS